VVGGQRTEDRGQQEEVLKFNDFNAFNASTISTTPIFPMNPIPNETHNPFLKLKT
jgi:hypothetical protein